MSRRLCLAEPKSTARSPWCPGGTPAIGILIGLIFSVINGDVQFFPGETGEILLSNPDATAPTDVGRVEYRHDQIFWVNAVSQLVNS